MQGWRIALFGVLPFSFIACAAAPGEVATDSLATTQEPTEPTEPSGPDFSSGQEISLAQHTTWTIDMGAPKTFRVVAYGDSIFAGYQRSIFTVARRSAPHVAGEYLAHRWGANVEVVRRTVSGAVSNEIVDDIEGDKSFMQTASTRAVYFEMCGNDYLQARSRLSNATGRCDLAGLDGALAGCTRSMETAMTKINANATAAKHKAIVNLYYPGFDADNVQARCTDASGTRINILKTLLPYMAHSNWRACTLAKTHGFDCVDAFAQYMGADYDANGDGTVDSEALRFDANESEADYVQRITVTLRGTLVDSNRHALSATTTADYLFTDDTHPTFFGNTVSPGTGRGAPDFTAAQVIDGKNPQWNRHGHERMGWAIAELAPATP